MHLLPSSGFKKIKVSLEGEILTSLFTFPSLRNNFLRIQMQKETLSMILLQYIYIDTSGKTTLMRVSQTFLPFLRGVSAG